MTKPDRRARVLRGNCLEALGTMPADSIDACVTDPPYELGFMGKAWDGGGVAFEVETWAAILRVLKPGAHLFAFGGTRTYHRLTCAIEDAGFEIRDCLMWVYGSGFPKSLDVSKAIDKAAGKTRQSIGERDRYLDGRRRQNKGNCAKLYQPGMSANGLATITAPATPAAQQWQGWGTALKPAYEPIILARKPLVGTVAANVQQYGTGAINVDGCRIEAEDQAALAKNWDRETIADMRGGRYGTAESGAMPNTWTAPLGRWPANLIHDGSDEVLALFPSPHGAGAARDGSTAIVSESYQATSYELPANTRNMRRLGDSGSAARFFYTAKASRRERGEGNTHPTVKPLALMRYLARLITPPDGLILDPFAGSGTTGCAAIREGFRFIGIEQDAASLKTAKQRTVETEFLPIERFLLDDDEGDPAW